MASRHILQVGAAVFGNMVGMDPLREIHINSCTPRIVMYSQGHIC